MVGGVVGWVYGGDVGECFCGVWGEERFQDVDVKGMTKVREGVFCFLVCFLLFLFFPSFIAVCVCVCRREFFFSSFLLFFCYFGVCFIYKRRLLTRKKKKKINK